MRIIVIIFLFLTTGNLVAQNAERPWFVGIGWNAVDYQTSEPSDMNTALSALRISAGRNLWGNLNLEASYAVNTISDHPGLDGAELDHASVDIMLYYGFGNLIYGGEHGVIDPYLGVGAGITWLEDAAQNDNQSNTLNAVAGVNWWVSPNLAVYTQGSYKNSTDDFADTYLEYAVGIRYVFSFSGNGICFP